MEAVKQAFSDRFGEATVPLLRVLDVEHGIGESLAHTLVSSRWPLRSRRSALMRLLVAALREGRQMVDLDDRFLASIQAADVLQMPPAAAALCSVAAAEHAGMPGCHHEIILRSVVGCVGTELWSRHARSDSSFVGAWRELQTRLRQRPSDVVRADVIFTPASGADVASRPDSERFRIVCSAVPPGLAGQDLPLDDLYVRLINDRLHLLSRSLACEVEPVIGSAIDPTAVASPAYRFLCQLAFQDWATPLVWDWGELSDSPFLPGVRWRNVVLAVPRWRVDQNDLAGAAPRVVGECARAARRAWCEERGLPRWVALRDGDETLPCDLWHPFGEDMLRFAIRRHGHVVAEALPPVAEGSAAPPGKRSRHVIDLIVPLLNAGATRRSAPSEGLRASQPDAWMAKFEDGSRLPGSDWIYAKLYASPLRIQALLRDELPQLVKRLRNECGLRCWFFFRYKDAEWHLRLRLLVPSVTARQHARNVLEATASRLRDREAIWRLQYDTYYREIERFGGRDSCALVEHIFSVESDLVLRALHTWDDESGYVDYAMQLAAGWVVWLWGQLGLASTDILSLCQTLARRHARAVTSTVQPSDERRVGESLADRAFRDRTKSLRGLPFADVEAQGGQWRTFCLRATKPLKQLRQLADEERLIGGRRNLAVNLAHLLIRRLYDELHDDHERVLYVQASRHVRRASWHHSITPAATEFVVRPADGAAQPP